MRLLVFLPYAFSMLVTAQSNGMASCNNITINSQSDPSTASNCTVIHGELEITLNASIAGPIEIPNVKTFQGSVFILGNSPDDPANITSFSMPSVENMTDSGGGGGIGFHYVDKLTAVSLPKLKYVDGFNIRNGNGPTINISLPALETVSGILDIEGNIDVFDIPNFKSVETFAIGSTGDLDCESLSRALSISTSIIVQRFFSCSGAAGISMSIDLWHYTPVASPLPIPTSIFVVPTTSSTIPQPTITSQSSQPTPTSNTASIRNVSWSLISSISAIVGCALF